MLKRATNDLTNGLKQHWPAWLLGVAFLCLYIATVSPGLQPADSGEFQLVVPLLGVAHPPGFSLYIILGKLFSTLVPIGSYAYRLNLFSAFTSSLTLVIVCIATNRLTRSASSPTYYLLITTYLPGLLLTTLLGLSTTFWSQATTTNIRSLMALLTALAMYAFVEYRLTPTVNRFAFLLFALSLAVIHHLSIAFIAAVLGLAALWLVFTNPLAKHPFNPLTKRTILKLLLALLAPLLVLLYLPIRGAQGALLAPPGLDTLNGFLQHALGLGFGGDFFYFANPIYWPDRFAILLNIFQFQFNDLALVLLMIGLIAFFFVDLKLAISLTLAFAVHCFVAITYRAPQTVEYLLPAYVILVVIAGAGLAYIVNRLSQLKFQPTLKTSLVVICHLSFVITSLFIFFRNYPAYQTLARDDSTRDYAYSLLTSAPPDALILSAWHQATPMWYLQYIEGVRTDVDVEYVFPQGTSLAQNWVDRITANAANRPTLVTSFYPTEYAALPYRFLPLLSIAPAWQAQPDPYLDPDLAPQAPTHEGGWTFISSNVIKLGPQTELMQNESFSVQTFWQAPETPTDINFFVQLIGPDGLLYGQADVHHPASALVPDEIISDRLTLAVNNNAPIGNGYSLVIGAYTPDGRRLAPDSTEIAKLAIIPAQSPPATRNPSTFGLLAGYDYDFSIPDSPRIYLHWRLDGSAHTIDLTDANNTSLGSVALPPLTGYLTTSHDFDPANTSISLRDGNTIISNLQSPVSNNSRYVSFGPLTLVDSTITRESDGSYRVDLDWLANQPITDDLVVKVDLVGENFAWRDQSDSIPAGGAIPTLKWIPGIVIHDRHRLTMLDSTSATFQIAVYDHFTLRNLPILDARLAQLGPTVPLGTVQP